MLRRRNAPALRLSADEREQQRDSAFHALGLVLRNLHQLDMAAVKTVLSETFPWMSMLPENDQDLFIDEFTQAIRVAAEIDRYAFVGQLLHEWRSAAAIHADDVLRDQFVAPITPDGAEVVAP